MNDTVLFVTAVTVLIAFILAPFIRWLNSYRAVILKRIKIKGEEERRRTTSHSSSGF